MFGGGSTDQRKMHLIRWDILYKAKVEGCIGLWCAQEFNKALLAKLVWRLLKDPNAVWRKTLLSKYGRCRKGFSVFKHKPGASYIWRGIISSFQTLKAVRQMFGGWKKK